MMSPGGGTCMQRGHVLGDILFCRLTLGIRRKIMLPEVCVTLHGVLVLDHVASGVLKVATWMRNHS